MAAPNRILRQANTVNTYKCACSYHGSMKLQEIQYKSGVFDLIICPTCGERIFAPRLKPDKKQK